MKSTFLFPKQKGLSRQTELDGTVTGQSSEARSIRRAQKNEGPALQLSRPLRLTLLAAALSMAAMAQGPWGRAADTIAIEFTGPIARGFSLVAIVVGGLQLAFSDGGGKRTIGGLVFGLGLALGATQFLTWLF